METEATAPLDVFEPRWLGLSGGGIALATFMNTHHFWRKPVCIDPEEYNTQHSQRR